MPNMKRTLMFTAYELIICVAPRETGSELALSAKKTEDHSTLDLTVFRQVLQCEIQREETSYFFLKVSTNVTGDERETILFI